MTQLLFFHLNATGSSVSIIVAPHHSAMHLPQCFFSYYVHVATSGRIEPGA
jgi:hypothetical protein